MLNMYHQESVLLILSMSEMYLVEYSIANITYMLHVFIHKTMLTSLSLNVLPILVLQRLYLCSRVVIHTNEECHICAINLPIVNNEPFVSSIFCPKHISA